MEPDSGGAGGTGETNGGGGGLTPDQQKIQAALSKTAEAPATQEPAHPAMPKVHKTIFKEPPKEVLEGEMGGDEGLDKLVTDDTVVEFPGTKKETATPQTAKKEVTPPARQTTATVKAGEKPAASTTDVVVDPTKVGQKFDYSGHTPEEIALLKQMSNPAREYVARLSKELKTLQQAKPESIFQHPEAYQLAPEYKEAGEGVKFCSMERDHWRQQLLNIRNGKPWYGLQGFRDDGTPVTSGPYKATDEAEVDVSNALTVITNQVGAYQQKQAEIQGGFKQRIDADTAFVQGERAKRFAWVNEPKLLEEKLSIPNVGDVTIGKIRMDFQSILPAYMSRTIWGETMADMFAALQVYAAKIRTLEAATANEKKIRVDAMSMEPAPEAVGGGKTKESGDFDMEGMPTD